MYLLISGYCDPISFKTGSVTISSSRLISSLILFLAFSGPKNCTSAIILPGVSWKDLNLSFTDEHSSISLKISLNCDFMLMSGYKAVKSRSWENLQVFGKYTFCIAVPPLNIKRSLIFDSYIPFNNHSITYSLSANPTLIFFLLAIRLISSSVNISPFQFFFTYIY